MTTDSTLHPRQAHVPKNLSRLTHTSPSPAALSHRLFSPVLFRGLRDPRLKPWGTQKQRQIPFGDDNKKSRGKATACLGWEVVWVEKQISPLRAARAGRNDVRKEVLILLILRSRVDFDGH